MSYKIYLFDSLSPIEWSQAGWKLEGSVVDLDDCRIEFIHDVILDHLPKGGLVVDAGCGVARWPIYLRQRGYRVFGLEWSHDACLIAKRTDPGLEVVRTDIRRTPLKDRSVDAVLSLGVVEHDEAGPLVALREARRILKPGGTLILAVPYNNPVRRLLINRLQSYVTRKRRRASWRLGFAEYRFSAREVRQFLEQCGFAVVSMHPNDLHPPKNMGLWVDYSNLMLNPFRPIGAEQLFIFPGAAGKVATSLARVVPWLVAGEVICVARAGASEGRPGAQGRAAAT
jgi:SAM-dependent methyltransferase